MTRQVAQAHCFPEQKNGRVLVCAAAQKKYDAS